MIDLDALERLAGEATPGPWRWGTGVDPDWSADTLVTVEKRERWNHGDRALHETVVLNEDTRYEDPQPNADYIAACDPVTVLALVRAVRAALADDRDALTYELDAALAPFRSSG